MKPLALEGAWKIAAAVVLGACVGAIFVRSRLSERKTLSEQFLFRDNRFAVAFLVSLAVGIPLFHFCGRAGMINPQPPDYPLWPSLLGACLLGLGAAFCGHVPSTAIASTASGRLYSLWALLGMLAAYPTARWLFPLLDQHLFPKLPNFSPDAWISRRTLLWCLPTGCLLLALLLRAVSPRRTQEPPPLMPQ